MQFKKVTSIFLAFFFLISNLGMAINVHFCHDKIASVSLGISISEPCETNSGSCCAKANNHKKCCSENTIKAEKKSDNVLVKSLQFDFQDFVLVPTEFEYFQQTSAKVQKNLFLDYYKVSNAPPHYKLNCQFIFYA